MFHWWIALLHKTRRKFARIEISLFVSVRAVRQLDHFLAFNDTFLGDRTWFAFESYEKRAAPVNRFVCLTIFNIFMAVDKKCSGSVTGFHEDGLSMEAWWVNEKEKRRKTKSVNVNSFVNKMSYIHTDDLKLSYIKKMTNIDTCFK